MQGRQGIRRPPAEYCNSPRLEQQQSFSRSVVHPLGTHQGVRVASPHDLQVNNVKRELFFQNKRRKNPDIWE